MSMTEWAKREIEIACEREKKYAENNDWEYGCACYESALKAFNSLMEDGHSGFSIVMTKNILNRLIDGKPLTPIEDVEEVWGEAYGRCRNDDYDTYQCERMSSLFKKVYDDGRVEYRDIDRVYCVDRESGCTYSNSFIRKMIDEMFPITMPYIADKKYEVSCCDYLTDSRNSDFDTMAIFYVIEKNSCERTEINRFFKEGPGGRGWVEIDGDEFDKRVDLHIAREERLAEMRKGAESIE